MDDLREALDRRARRLQPAPDALDHVIRRAVRRQRSRRLLAAGLAFLLVAGSGTGLWAAFRPRQRAVPTQHPSLVPVLSGKLVIDGPNVSALAPDGPIFWATSQSPNETGSASLHTPPGRLFRVDPSAVVGRTGTVRNLPWAGPVLGSAGSVWVGEQAAGLFGATVFRISPSGGRLLASIGVGSGLHEGVRDLAAGEGTVWVADRLGVQRIDPASNRLVATIPAPHPNFDRPDDIGLGVLDRSASFLVTEADGMWAAQSHSVWRIDPTNNRVDAEIHLDGVTALAFGDTRLWAAVSTGSKLFLERIDPATAKVDLRTLVPGSAVDMTVAQHAVWLAASEGESNRLLEVDPVTGRTVHSLELGGGAPVSALAVSGRTMLVGYERGGVLYRVELISCAEVSASDRSVPGCSIATSSPFPSRSPLPPSRWPLTSIRMIDASRGWATSQAIDADRLQIFGTEDGGATWTATTPARLTAWADSGVFFLDVRHAWLAVADASPLASERPATRTTVYRTSDDGATWEAGASFRMRGRGTLLDFVDPLHGWGLVDGGSALGSQAVQVFRTTDGGVHWTRTAEASLIGRPDGSGLTAGCDKSGITFVTASTGWINGACSGGIPYFAVTRDGGSTWRQQQVFTAGAR